MSVCFYLDLFIRRGVFFLIMLEFQERKRERKGERVNGDKSEVLVIREYDCARVCVCVCVCEREGWGVGGGGLSGSGRVGFGKFAKDR